MMGLEQYVGTVLANRYRIDRPIGVGGMGAVFEAFQLDLGRRVALKLLLSAADPEGLARFKTEALAVAAASHVNVVSIFEFSVEHDPPFLAMELLEGRTLHARLKEGPLDPRAAVDIAVQVLSALQTAHAKGVIHRDLKPSNIFLTSNVLGIDLVKVLDFGIAKVAGTKGQTATGAVVGTPAYMAPEQLLGETVDARSDVHAVGVLLYEMLSGARAFVPGVDVAVRVVRDVPPRLETLRADVPRALADLVARALAKEPAARFEDARSMLAAVEACRASLAAAGPPKQDLVATAGAMTARVQPATPFTAGMGNEAPTQAAPNTAPFGAQPATPSASPAAPNAHAATQDPPRTPFQARPAPPFAPPAPFDRANAPRPVPASGGGRMVLFVVVPVALVVALGVAVVALLVYLGESNTEKERQRLAALALRACPPPSTCTGTMLVMDEKVSYCTTAGTIPPYGKGDGVFVKDGLVTAFARITAANKDGTFNVERFTGYKLTVPPEDIFGRACRR